MNERIEILAKIFLFQGMLWITCIIVIILIANINKKRKGFKLPNNIQYYRDIPTKDLDLALWIGINYYLIEDKCNFLGVMLLKWIREEKIKIKREAEKIFIDFTQHFKTEDTYERDIYHLFLIASGINHILEEHEFVNYLLIDSSLIDRVYKTILENIDEELRSKNLLAWNPKTAVPNLMVSNEIEEIAIKMAGLKKFLKEFSIIEQKKSEEVFLWEYYLIYAQCFGMADEVSNEFRNLYPSSKKVNNLKIEDVTFVGTLIKSLKIGLNKIKEE